jgi:hypothetical protein
MTNTIIAFLEVFIVTPRKESAQYPLGASFHSSAGPNQRVSGTPLSTHPKEGRHESAVVFLGVS